MHTVIQRVARASVDVEGTTVGEVAEPGLMVLLGVAQGNGCEQVTTLVRKTAELHIPEGERSVMEVDALILVVN